MFKTLFKQNSSKGFTLIEVIVVIGIVSILTIFIITVLDPLGQIQKANDARRKSDISQIQKTLETYYQDNARYPPNPSSLDYRIKGLDGNPIPWGQSWQPYINVLPKDPNLSKNYVYLSGTDGQTYYLYANLDRGGKDLQACHADGSKCNNAPEDSGSVCGGICNYGVSSPNVSP